MKAIKISPDPTEALEIVEVEKHYHSLAAVIGGPCQYVERFRCPLTPAFGLVGVLDEDGQSNGQPENMRAWPLYPVPGYSLRGTILVMAEGMTPEGIEFVDLPNPDTALAAVGSLLELREEVR